MVEPNDDISSEYHKALDTLNGVLSQVQGIGTTLGALFGADQTAPFTSQRDRIVSRWNDACSNADDAGRVQATVDMGNLASSAQQTLLGIQGDTAVPKGQNAPSVGNTLGGNLADQAGKVGAGLGIGIGTILIGAVAVHLLMSGAK